MTEAEAYTLVDLLLEAHQPVTTSWGIRVLEYGRAERSGAPERVAQALAELYAEAALTPAQELMVRRLEDQLLPRMAEALGEPVGKLRARLHSGRKVFDGDAPFEAEEPQYEEHDDGVPRAGVAGPEGWVHWHSFRVFGQALAIGSRPDDVESSLTFAARNGEWHVFRAPSPRRWFGALFGQKPPSVVFVHSEALADVVRQLNSTKTLERTEGRFTSVVDGAARRDPRIRSYLESGEGTGRSYTFSTEGNGHEWRGVRDDDGKLQLVTTTLDLEDE